MAKIRNKYELNLIRKSGWIAACAMKKTLQAVKPGINLLELESIANEEIERLGGKGAFKTVPGYKWTTCLSVNHEIVHGTPRDIKLKEGDLITVDLGANYKGWNTDTAWSVIVGGKQAKFLEAGERAMWEGIALAVEGNRVGDISNAIQTVLEKENNYFVSRTLIGHGVGRSLHEDPEVPGFGEAGKGAKLYTGMTIAIEAIYTENKTDSRTASDGWTVESVDKSLAGMFEMTVIVGLKKPEVITDWRNI